jgi:hypothetical protein
MPRKTVEELKAALTCMVERGELMLKKFRDELNTDPEYAMAWGDKGFEGTAMSWAAKYTLNLLDCMTPTDLLEHLREMQQDRMNNAVPRSTSPCSNLLDQFNLVALGNVIKRVKQAV